MKERKEGAPEVTAVADLFLLLGSVGSQTLGSGSAVEARAALCAADLESLFELQRLVQLSAHPVCLSVRFALLLIHLQWAEDSDPTG